MRAYGAIFTCVYFALGTILLVVAIALLEYSHESLERIIIHDDPGNSSAASRAGVSQTDYSGLEVLAATPSPPNKTKVVVKDTMDMGRTSRWTWRRGATGST